MVDAVGELIAAAGQAIVEDNKFLDDKKKSPIILRVLYYLVPMSILTGIYIWVAYYWPLDMFQSILQFRNYSSQSEPRPFDSR